MNKKTLYEFSVSEAETKLKNFISEDESGDIEVKILVDSFTNQPTYFTNKQTCGTSQTEQEYWEVTEVNKKTSEILDECRSKFSVYSYYDNKQLDKVFPIPEMTTRKFKANVEADEDLKNMSANKLKEKGIKGITLRERLLLELQYFNETGKHLDLYNITLCSGSRYDDGNVPCVDWNSNVGRLGVYWYYSGDSADSLRSRVVVS